MITFITFIGSVHHGENVHYEKGNYFQKVFSVELLYLRAWIMLTREAC